MQGAQPDAPALPRDVDFWTWPLLQNWGWHDVRPHQSISVPLM
jgi:hypothetical protein